MVEEDRKGVLSAHVADTNLLTREGLKTLPLPERTATHWPVSHHELVTRLLESLSFRHINIVREEYAASTNGMKLFGVLELETTFDGCRFALGVRNANDKSMRLAMTVGYRVFVCDNMAFHGDFTPVLAKHTRGFRLEDVLAIGLDRVQRAFEPMLAQVSVWRQAQISDQEAKDAIYAAFILNLLEAPLSLGEVVHNHYFNPLLEVFNPRTVWSLSNAFTMAFKELEPVPRFKATAHLGGFLQRHFASREATISPAFASITLD